MLLRPIGIQEAAVDGGPTAEEGIDLAVCLLLSSIPRRSRQWRFNLNLEIRLKSGATCVLHAAVWRMLRGSSCCRLWRSLLPPVARFLLAL